MKRTTLILSAALIAVAPVAYAQQPLKKPPQGEEVQKCEPGQPCYQQKKKKKQPPKAQPQQNQLQHQNGQTPKERHQQQNTQAQKQQHKLPGHALTDAQRAKLPKPPKGQEYRIVDDKIVRVDSDTAAIIVTLGLLLHLLNQ